MSVQCLSLNTAGSVFYIAIVGGKSLSKKVYTPPPKRSAPLQKIVRHKPIKNKKIKRNENKVMFCDKQTLIVSNMMIMKTLLGAVKTESSYGNNAG